MSLSSTVHILVFVAGSTRDIFSLDMERMSQSSNFKFLSMELFICKNELHCGREPAVSQTNREVGGTLKIIQVNV